MWCVEMFYEDKDRKPYRFIEYFDTEELAKKYFNMVLEENKFTNCLRITMFQKCY